MKETFAKVTLAILAVAAWGCVGDANSQDGRRWIAADVDQTAPIGRIEFELAHGLIFTIDFLEARSDAARVCFALPDKTVCRVGVVPSSASLRPVAITRDAPDEVMVGFLLPDGTHLDIWLAGTQIAMTDNERMCLVRGKPLDTIDCS